MRILLDESLPIELRDELPQHIIRSVREMGWSALANGELLRRAVGQFDVFVTADQNLQYRHAAPRLRFSFASASDKRYSLGLGKVCAASVSSRY